MSCEHIDLGSPLARRLHRLRCPECRAARDADRGLLRGIEHLRAEPAPTAGLARTLAAVGAVPIAPAHHSNSRKRAAARRVLMPTGATTALVIAGVGGWLYYIDLDPGIPVPMPAMPAHNAYDLFRQAYHAEFAAKVVDEAVIGNPRKVQIRRKIPLIPGAAKRTAPPNSDMGAAGAFPTLKVLNEAGKLGNSGMSAADALPTPPGQAISGPHALSTGEMRQPGMQAQAGQGISGPYGTLTTEVVRPWTLAEKAHLVEENAPALLLLRQGLQLEYWAPPVRSPNDSLAYLEGYRALAHLLELEAQVREARGDVMGAVNSRLDAMELGVKIARGSVSVGRQIGFRCEEIGREHLWRQVDRLNATQARYAARRMERIIQLRVPFADTLLEEEWAGMATIKEVFRMPGWRRSALVGVMLNGADYTTSMGYGFYKEWGWPETLTLLPYTKRRILLNYMAYMENLASEARFGYDARKFRAKEQHNAARLSKLDPLTRMIGTEYSPMQYIEVAGTETQDALLTAALALRAYEQEHHRYPTTLSVLIPRYLDAVPVDPFGHGKPLGYRCTGQKSISIDGGRTWYLALYSVGPDGNDDGGKPIQDPTAGGSQLSSHVKEAVSLYIRPESTGDIIAGLNVNAIYTYRNAGR